MLTRNSSSDAIAAMNSIGLLRWRGTVLNSCVKTFAKCQKAGAAKVQLPEAVAAAVSDPVES
jgi:hypothetical protein